MKSANDTILVREFKSNIVDLMLFFISINKHIFEYNNFLNGLICSWNVKIFQGFPIEIIMGITNKNDVFGEIIKAFAHSTNQFVNPNYEQYAQYVANKSESESIIKKAINHVLDYKCNALEEEQYNRQLLNLRNNLCNDWLSIYDLKINRHESIESAHSKRDIEINTNMGSLAFIGQYWRTNNDVSLEYILAYRVIEKIFGFGDSYSIYSSLRNSGQIYSAYSAYLSDDNMFITGVICNYSKDMECRCDELIENHKISSEMIEIAKSRVLQDIQFSLFSFGAKYTFMQYELLLLKKIDFQTIVKQIGKLSTPQIIEIFRNIDVYKISVGG